MKIRVAVAVFCLAFSVAASCLVFVYVETACGSLIRQAETLLQNAEEAGPDYEGVEAFYASWEAHGDVLCTFVHHKDADELRQRFSRLERSALLRDPEGVCAALEDCRISLLVIAQGEKPKLSNIF